MGNTAPVPTGDTSQHLREAAGVLFPTVDPMVPQQLIICSLQPGHRKKGSNMSASMAENTNAALASYPKLEVRLQTVSSLRCRSGSSSSYRRASGLPASCGLTYKTSTAD